MSILFGFLYKHGVAGTEQELLRLSRATERYARDGLSIRFDGRLGMGLQPLFSHERSAMDRLPVEDQQGNVIGFDGRLDNHRALREELGLGSIDTSDSSIMLAAFDRWGADCFRRFTGDWALALWSSHDERLYLARDHAGTRTLYFQQIHGKVMWSTYLDTLRAADQSFHLNETYAGRYLSSTPIRDLTPYEGVCSVPPSHYVVLSSGNVSRHRYWSATEGRSIQYGSDDNYDSHFLSLFWQSVARRTGPGAPILAELSGGMDSTSIVCMSDHIRRSQSPTTELLDTVSYYDDSELSLNERPYFTITEARRGKTGTHIDASFAQRIFEPHSGMEGAYLFPGADSFSIQYERRFQEAVWRRGYRSILSGIGGDEVLGGVPDPLPELAGHLVSGNAHKLFHQTLAWCLVDRTPVLGLLFSTLRYSQRLYFGSRLPRRAIPPWLSKSLRGEIEWSERGPSGTRFSTQPARLESSLSWESIMETLPHLFPPLLYRPEYRYPFLDKDLVDFLFAIPREQLLRPGRRRALMRRALKGIVPEEILERRRKAFQLRAPLATLQAARPTLEELFTDPISAQMGFIDMDRLRPLMDKTLQGDPTWWQALTRLIAFELWLRASHLAKEGQASMTSTAL